MCIQFHNSPNPFIGDRTPITPLLDESFWKSTLPSDSTLASISRNTRVNLDNDFHAFLDAEEAWAEVSKGEGKHLAKGGPIYGQLTQLGLLQMIELGSRLREDLKVAFGSVVRPTEVKVRPYRLSFVK